jgi:hypothetical protein
MTPTCCITPLVTVIFWLVAAHFVIDYPLQGDTTAREKNRHSATDLQKHVPWYYWLTAHALMHGAAVAAITHSVWLGVAETAAHWAIDFGKCERWFSIHADQALHLGCKAVWLVIAVGGLS